MRLVQILVALFPLALAAIPAKAQSNSDEARRWCLGGNGISRDLLIAGCTWVIRSGQEPNSNLAIAFYNRGLAQQNQGDPAGAIADYNQAISLNPADALAFSSRGNARRNQGDLRGARADSDTALRLNPRNAYAFANRCVLRIRQGEATQAAMADCNAGIAAAAAGNAWPHIARAGLALLRDDRNAAAMNLAEALRRDTREAYALRLRALLHARSGAARLAEADAAAARAIDPKIDIHIVEEFGPGITR